MGVLKWDFYEWCLQENTCKNVEITEEDKLIASASLDLPAFAHHTRIPFFAEVAYEDDCSLWWEEGCVVSSSFIATSIIFDKLLFCHMIPSVRVPIYIISSANSLVA